MKYFLYLAVSVLFLVLYTRYIEKRSIFFPFKEIEATPQSINLEFEDIYFNTRDGEKLNGWFVPARHAKGVVLILHGNGGNISHRLERITIFNGLGLDVFLIDYRGYGRSSGRPTEQGLYLDAEASYDYLVKHRKFEPGKIIIFGESLGCAAAVDLASKNKISALILESPFTNAKEMSRTIYPFLPTIFLSVSFDSLAKIRKVTCPKLIIHSRNDEIVPFKLGRKVFEASPEPKQFLEIIGGHNTAFFDCYDLFVAEVKQFIEGL